MTPDDPETQRWTAIGLGLAIGLGAKYALLMQDRRQIGLRDLLIDALLLAANALMASMVVVSMGWHGQQAIAVAALFGASSDRVVRILRKQFERQVHQRASVLFAQAGVPVTVPPSHQPTEVQMIGDSDPRLRPIQRLLETLDGKTDADIEALIARLNQEKGAGE